MRSPPLKILVVVTFAIASLGAVNVAAAQDYRAFAATPQCIDDPSGDVFNFETFETQAYPRADIVRACLTYGDTVSVSVQVGQATNPTTDPNWTDGFTGVDWGLDANNDELPDHLAIFYNNQGQVRLDVAACGETSQGWTCSTANLACSGTPAFGSGTYSGSFPATCIGAPPQLHFQARMSYDEMGTTHEDEAPDDLGWFGPVAKDTGGGGTGGGTGGTGSGSARPTARLAGPDRFSTAVEISKYQFPNGAQEVYLARSDNYPDALAGGALTKGPVLLVPRCGTLPTVVKAEIARLNPGKVVALGGPGAVCDAMLSQAANA